MKKGGSSRSPKKIDLNEQVFGQNQQYHRYILGEERINYPGGFRINENQLENKQKLKQQIEQEHEKLKSLQTQLLQKVDQTRQVGFSNEMPTQKRFLGDQLGGIKDKFLHSVDNLEVKNEFTDQIIENLEKEREKIRMRRQNMLENYFEKNQNIQENNLLRHAPEIQGFLNKNNKNDSEIEQILQEVQDIETVEEKLKRHREKMMHLEVLYSQKTGQEQIKVIPKGNIQDYIYASNNEAQKVVDFIHRENPEAVKGVHSKLQQYAGIDMQRENARPSQNQKQKQQPGIPLSVQKEQKRIQIINEEMQQIQNKIFDKNQKQAKNKVASKDDQHVINSKVEERRSKLEDFLAEKEVKKVVELKLNERQKGDFETLQTKQSYRKHKDQESQKLQNLGKELDIPEIRSLKEQKEWEIQEGLKCLEGGGVLNLEMGRLYRRALEDRLKCGRKGKSDEDFVLRYLFLSIDRAGSGFVSVGEVLDFFKGRQDSKELEDYLGLVKSSFEQDLKEYRSKRVGLLDLGELMDFLRNQSEQSLKRERERRQKEARMLEKERKRKEREENVYEVDWKRIKSQEGTCVLSESQMGELERIFKKVDKYDDQVISKSDLVMEILDDEKVKKWLKRPAVKVEKLKRVFSLEVVILQIKNSVGVDDSSKYITWSQFRNYFIRFEVPSIRVLKEIFERKQKSSEEEIIDIDLEAREFLEDQFDSVARVEGEFVNTFDWVLQVQRDPQYFRYQGLPSRNKSKETGLPAETIDETIQRVVAECDECISWEELRLYFTRRGRPKDSYSTMLLEFPPGKDEEIDQDGEDGEDLDIKQFKQQDKEFNMKVEQNFSFGQTKQDNQFDNQIQENTQKKIQTNTMTDTKQGKNSKQNLNQSQDTSLRNNARPVQSESQENLRVLNKNKNVGRINSFSEERKKQEFQQQRGGEVSEKKKQFEEVDFEKIELKEGDEGLLGWEKVEFLYKPFDIDQILKLKRDVKKMSRSLGGSFTVPEAFEVGQRSKNSSQSIRGKRVQEMVQKKREEEEMACSYRFEAKEVPLSSKVLMWETIRQEQKEKSEATREQRKVELIENARPFSFYYKEKERGGRQLEEIKKNLLEENKQKKEGVVDSIRRAQEVVNRADYLRKLDEERKKRKELEKQIFIQKRVEERKKLFEKHCSTITMKNSIQKYQTRQEIQRSGQALTGEEQEVQEGLRKQQQELLKKKATREKGQKNKAKKGEYAYLEEDNARQKKTIKNKDVLESGGVMQEMKKIQQADQKIQQNLKKIENATNQQTQFQQKEKTLAELENKYRQIYELGKTFDEEVYDKKSMQVVQKTFQTMTGEEIKRLHMLREKRDKDEKELKEKIKKDKEEEKIKALREDWKQSQIEEKQRIKQFQDEIQEKVNKRPLLTDNPAKSRSNFYENLNKMIEKEQKNE